MLEPAGAAVMGVFPGDIALEGIDFEEREGP